MKTLKRVIRVDRSHGHSFVWVRHDVRPEDANRTPRPRYVPGSPAGLEPAPFGALVDGDVFVLRDETTLCFVLCETEDDTRWICATGPAWKAAL